MKTTNPPWSSPQLDSFSTCPHQYYHTRVLCDVDPVATDLARAGQSFVEALSQALATGVTPDKLRRFVPLVEMLRALPGKASINTVLAVDERFSQCTADKAWLKSKVHYIRATEKEALLFEWRTGAKEPNDALKLSAALYFCLNPVCESLQCQTIWFRANKIERNKYTRADMGNLFKQFIPVYERFRSAHEHNEWPAQPCGLCKKYCNVKDCKYNGI